MHRFKLKDKVIHKIDKAPFEVVGIRETEVEIKGDFSGGTHNVSQTDWVNPDELTLFEEYNEYDYEVLIKDNTIFEQGSWVPIMTDRIKRPENIEKYLQHGILRKINR